MILSAILKGGQRSRMETSEAHSLGQEPALHLRRQPADAAFELFVEFGWYDRQRVQDARPTADDADHQRAPSGALLIAIPQLRDLLPAQRGLDRSAGPADPHVVDCDLCRPVQPAFPDEIDRSRGRNGDGVEKQGAVEVVQKPGHPETEHTEAEQRGILQTAGQRDPVGHSKPASRRAGGYFKRAGKENRPKGSSAAELAFTPMIVASKSKDIKEKDGWGIIWPSRWAACQCLWAGA